MEKRIDKINYYLDIAETVASRSTCLRKKYGTVIVNHDQIISTGYSGAPRGRKNCCDIGYCTKKKLLPDQRHGGYDACRSVHSEQNAIIRKPSSESVIIDGIAGSGKTSIAMHRISYILFSGSYLLLPGNS